jgi:glycosyltransferase involved in cell wall biosynthesis
MSDRPLVSVVIPARDRRDVLPRALRSLQAQRFGDWEAVVVDDGSADGTAEAARTFADVRVRVIRHEAGRGPAAARNTGIRATGGRIVAFLDSDDEWRPEKLQRQVEAFASAPAEVGVVYTGTLRHFGGKTYEIPAPSAGKREGDVFAAVLRGTYLVPTPAAAVRREVFESAGLFDESLPALEEWDLWIRLSRFCRFAFVPEPLVVSHFTPGSLSSDRRLFRRAKGLILRKHLPDFLERPGALLSVLASMARLTAGHALARIRPDGTAGDHGVKR